MHLTGNYIVSLQSLIFPRELGESVKTTEEALVTLVRVYSIVKKVPPLPIGEFGILSCFRSPLQTKMATVRKKHTIWIIPGK